MSSATGQLSNPKPQGMVLGGGGFEMCLGQGETLSWEEQCPLLERPGEEASYLSHQKDTARKQHLWTKAWTVLSCFVSLQQNTTDWVIYKEKACLWFTSVEAGNNQLEGLCLLTAMLPGPLRFPQVEGERAGKHTKMMRKERSNFCNQPSVHSEARTLLSWSLIAFPLSTLLDWVLGFQPVSSGDTLKP
jgi:hypothetical protein